MDNETPGTDVSEENKYYAVCDYCNFSLPCQRGYDIEKKPVMIIMKKSRGMTQLL